MEAIGLRDCTVYQLQQLMASSKIVPSVVSVEVHPFYKNEELVSFCKKKVSPSLLPLFARRTTVLSWLFMPLQYMFLLMSLMVGFDVKPGFVMILSCYQAA